MQRSTLGTLFCVTAAAWLTATAVTPANAFWPDFFTDAREKMRDGCEQNAMWPYPYVCPDRVRAHAPFDIMVANGWRRQNLLGSHHFDDDTNQLTRAGELKVRWILTQTPPNRRQIYIERSLDPKQTEAHIAAAKAFAVAATIDGSEPVVLDTHLMSEGSPAAMVDHVQKSFRDSMAPPVLPAGSSGTSANTN